MATYIGKIWKHKSLAYAFARRDLKIKFAQTWLGLSWSIVQPLFATVVYTLFFTFVVKIPTNDTPYILFVLSGLSLWSLFTYIFSQGVGVLLGNQEVIRKMAFPKIILPLSKVIVGFLEFLVSFTLFFVAWTIWNLHLDWKLFLILIPIAGIALFGFALTLLLLTFSIKQRDLLHIGPFLVYFGIWFTPVFYPVSLIPEQFKDWIYLNPAAGMIDFFRWTTGISASFSNFYIVDFAVILVLFAFSVFLFKNAEDGIVDNI